MTKVGSTNCLNMSHSITLGTNNAGKPSGNAPTTGVPEASSPSARLRPAAPSTTTNTVGKVGRQRLANTSNTSVTKPNTRLAQSMPTPVMADDQPFVKPNNAGTCDEMMSTPAPCVNAINTGELTKFNNQPKRAKPNTTCSKPVMSDSHTVRLTHSALPGVAMPPKAPADAVTRMASLVEQAMKDSVTAAGATLLHIHLHKFTPNGGVSGVAVLSESHISVHTWPEKGFAAFDVFMCGAAEPQKAIAVLEAAFRPTRVVVGEHKRGIV